MTSTVLITLVVMETFNMPYCTACKLISLFIAILLTTAIQRIPYSQCNKNERLTKPQTNLELDFYWFRLLTLMINIRVFDFRFLCFQLQTVQALEFRCAFV